MTTTIVRKIREYVEACGGYCLACGSTKLAYTINPNTLRRWVTCDTCHASWAEELRIQTVSHYDGPNDHIAYKVVKYADGNFYSITMGASSVTYSRLNWTDTPYQMELLGYYLTAFDDLECALEFYRRIHNEDVERQIWKVRCISPQKVPERRLTPGSLQTAARYGEIESDGVKIVPGELEWPNGTVMYKKMMLMDRLL